MLVGNLLEMTWKSRAELHKRFFVLLLFSSLYLNYLYCIVLLLEIDYAFHVIRYLSLHLKE